MLVFWLTLISSLTMLPSDTVLLVATSERIDTAMISDTKAVAAFVTINELLLGAASFAAAAVLYREQQQPLNQQKQQQQYQYLLQYSHSIISHIIIK